MAIDHNRRSAAASRSEQFLRGDILQFIDLAFAEAQIGQHPPRDFGALVRCRHSEGRPALNARLVKKPFGFGHGHKRTDLGAAPRFAEYSHVSRVASEMCDIVPDPFERCNKVELPHVPNGILRTESTEVRITENVETMIDADENNILLAHEPVAEERQGIRSAREPTAVDVDHHRPPSVQPGGKHIQVEAILAVDLCGKLDAIRPATSEIFTDQRMPKILPGPWMQRGPVRVASRMPVQFAGFEGGRNRFVPSVGPP